MLTTFCLLQNVKILNSSRDFWNSLCGYVKFCEILNLRDRCNTCVGVGGGVGGGGMDVSCKCVGFHGAYFLRYGSLFWHISLLGILFPGNGYRLEKYFIEMGTVFGKWSHPYHYALAVPLPPRVWQIKCHDIQTEHKEHSMYHAKVINDVITHSGPMV